MFLLYLLFFSFADISALSVFNGPELFLSRCFFYAVLLERGSFRLVAVAGFFALLPSFIVTDSLGADLVVMIPLALLLYQASRVTDFPLFLKACMVVACLMFHALIIDYGWSGVTSSFSTLIMHFLIALFMLY
jgi:hypothetical protein